VLKEQPYVYGTHYLPHDADYVRLGRTRRARRAGSEMLEELLPGHTFDVVPRVEDVTLGIQQTRNSSARLYMDELECAGLIAALESYRKEWDDKQQV
jgi:hypothetical protein